jgi:zeaxanthin glucosyltransferase
MKKTIGIVPYPEYGGYFPTFSLVKELLKNGLEIIFLGPIDFKELVEKQGFRFETILEDSYTLEMFKPDQIPEKMNFLEKIKYWADLSIKTALPVFKIIYTGHFEKLLDQYKLDLLMIDSILMPISIAACATKIKVINFACELNSHSYDNLPTIMYLLPSKNIFIYFFQTRLSWVSIIFKRYCNYFFYTILLKFFNIPKIPPEYSKKLWQIKKITKKRGIKYIEGEYISRPLLPELVLCFSEFDFPQSKQISDKHYMRSCVDEERIEIDFPWENIDDNKVLIYCSLGTHIEYYTYAHHFLRIIADVAKNTPDFCFIISAGKNTKKLKSMAPSNLIAVDKTPQLEVLKRARLMITNGGLGTVKECILNEVPMIVFPCKFDQPGNAARVVYHGIGLKGNIKKITSFDLSKMIDKILKDESFNKNIRQMHQNILTNAHRYEDLATIMKYLN